jgi:hypothetical protein
LAVQQDDEFVAALAAYIALRAFARSKSGDVLAAQPSREPLRDDAQEVVAHGVAERVVDALEVVEVEKHDRERLGVASRGVESLGELFMETGAVRQLGEDVEIRQAVNLLYRARTLSRVLQRTGDSFDPSRLVHQRLAEDVHVPQRRERRVPAAVFRSPA